MPVGKPTPQTIATKKYEKKAGWMSKSYKLKREVVEEFAYWLQDFCFEYDSLNNSSRRLKNNKLYDLNKKEDYMQAIVEYISGMTDNKVINTYNKLISF